MASEDLAFLQRFSRRGEIAPREATRFWGISRATAYRRLLRLEKQYWIVRHGATTATRYTFTAQARALLKKGSRLIGDGAAR